MSPINCVVILALLSVCEGRVQTANGTLTLQVGGSAGCPHAARYVARSVGPAYDKYRRFLRIQFVPWGKTRRVNGELECQFGARDCWANRLHRCALELLKGDEDAMVGYMVCEFTAPRPGLSGSYHCAERAGLRLVEVDNCMATAAGTALEAAMEAAAAEPIRVFNSIPYTVINGVIDRATNEQASRRLDSLICFALADDPSTGITSCKI